MIGQRKIFMEPIVRRDEAREPKNIEDAYAMTHEEWRAWLAPRLQRAQYEMWSEIIILVPNLADVLLPGNIDNRRLRAGPLVRLKEVIARREFVDMNGEALIIANTGEINTGQHRLYAVKETGRHIIVMITFGAERETRMSLDQATPKQTSDALTMIHGPIQNNVTVAAISRQLWLWDNVWEEKPGQKLGRAQRPTIEQVTDVFERERNAIYSCLSVLSGRARTYSVNVASGNKLIGGVSVLCVMMIKTLRIEGMANDEGMEQITNFIFSLRDGTNIEPGSSVLAARNRIIQDPRVRGSASLKAQLMAKAWNIMRAGGKKKIITLYEGTVGLTPKLI